MNEEELELFNATMDAIEASERRRRIPAKVQEARAEGLDTTDALALATFEVNS
jgi:hypothetical protein